jgi:threonine aldolase
MVVIENSHNHAGGRVPSIDYMTAVREMAQAAGVAVHIDGARVFNAAVALGVDVRTIAAFADSITFCLSKGLSAPMGSVLAGSHTFIERARVFRRMVGGGLRQSGYVAAAGVVALREMTGRLGEDNRRAAGIWQILHDAAPDLVDATAPQTNIVMITPPKTARGPRDANAWMPEFERHGVRLRTRDSKVLRVVTHRHITDEDVKPAAAAILRCVDEYR